MSKWQRPKQPEYTTGRLVIHSDDGRLWDYTDHFPIIQRAVTRHNQFNPSKSGIFCPGINTAYTGTGKPHRTVGLPVMDWEMVDEIAKGGGEILSHVKTHVYLDYTKISKPLEVGATRIYYSLPWGRFVEGAKIFISEGSVREDLLVTNVFDNGGTHNYIDVSTPTVNAFTTAARMHLHEDSLEEYLGGIVSDLAERGIACKHHINPWYDSSAVSLVVLKRHFESVITQIGDTVKPEDINFYDMKRTIDIRSASFSDLDDIIADAQLKDGVAFVQMHGNPDPKNFANLDYIVSKGLEMGMRVVTHSEAIEFIKSKKLNTP